MKVSETALTKIEEFLNTPHQNFDMLEVSIERYKGQPRRGWLRAVPHMGDWGTRAGWHVCCYVEVALSNEMRDLEEDYKNVRGDINGGVTFHETLDCVNTMVIGCDYAHSFNRGIPGVNDVRQSLLGLALTASHAEDKYGWLML